MLEKQIISNPLKDLEKQKDSLKRNKEVEEKIDVKEGQESIAEGEKNESTSVETAESIGAAQNELAKLSKLEESRLFLLGGLKYLKENFVKLKDDKIIPEYKKKTYETFKDLRKFLELSGAEMIKEVGLVYNYYESHSHSPLVVRREDPEKVVSLVGDGKLSLGFDTKVAGDRGDKYANCALWPYGPTSSGGVLNALAEGHGHAGPLITLIMVNPKIGNLTVEEPEGKMHQLGTLDRSPVKILSGDIKSENLEFIITRIPIDYFSEDLLTEAEKIQLADRNKKLLEKKEAEGKNSSKKKNNSDDFRLFVQRAFVFSKYLKDGLKEKK